MKKNKLTVILVALLACVLTGALFSACAPKGEEKFTVTFTVDGAEYQTQTVLKNQTAIEPKQPTAAEGYQFDGWMLDGNPFSFDTPISANITLTASFSEKVTRFTVKFMMNGADSEEVYATESVGEGEAVTPPADPERSGYFFGGWRLQGEKYNFTRPVTGDLVLRAKWYTDDTKVWTVTFDTGYGLDYDKVVDREALDVPEDPVRAGYEFVDWFSNGEKFDFDAEVRGDLTLTAVWRTEALQGKGTESEPYLLDEYAAFDLLARKLNIARQQDDTDDAWAVKVAEYERYASAYYTMTQDVALPAAMQPIANNTLYPFKGRFDAQGHTLSGLKITRTVSVNGLNTVGLFGAAHGAKIENVVLRGLDIKIKSANGYTDAMYIGGVVGTATACAVRYCTVDGVIASELYNEDAQYTATTYLGGVVGEFDSEVENGVATLGLIAYAKSEVTVCGDKNSRVGGIAGTLNGSAGPVALVNSYWAGEKLIGGDYVGGIVARIMAYNSVINCYAKGALTGLADDAYLGGIAASVAYGDVIADCYSEVTLSAPVAGAGSVAGPIVAYVMDDDYEYYRVVGGTVTNCYFLTSTMPTAKVNADTVNTSGRAQKTVNKSFFADKLKWTETDWDFSDALPELRARDTKPESVSYKVTLQYEDETGTKTIEKTVSSGTPIGKLDAAPNYTANGTPYVFCDWVYDGVYNRPYNFAMPVYKDITLYANQTDVSDIVGYWYRNDGDPTFAIYFGPDGSAKWLSDSLSSGSYVFTGDHICFQVANGKDEAASSYVNGDKTKITFQYAIGMSDEVYNMSKASALNIDTALVNAYADTSGRMLYIVSDTVLYYENEEDIFRGTYAVSATEAGVYEVTFDKALAMGITSAKFRVGSTGGMTIETDFVGTNEQYAEQNSYVPLVEPNYEDEAFLGLYWLFFGDSYGGSYSKVELNADGTARVVNLVGENEYPYSASYIYVPEAGMIKLFYETHTSNFVWDEENDLFYGVYNRGTTIRCSLYLTRERPRGFMIETDGVVSRNNTVFVTDDAVYFTIGNRNDLTATTDTQPAGFVDGARVRITPTGGTAQDYRIVGNVLYPIGVEEGTYTNTATGAQVTIDGIGNVVKNGNVAGIYRLYDTLLVIEYADDTLEAFDYAAAQGTDCRYTEATPQSRQGVWYTYDATAGVLINCYHSDKMVFDGFGHVLRYYWSDNNTYDESDDAYRLNYLNPGIVEEKTLISSYTEFNDYNKATFTFLRDDNILVFRVTNSSRDEIMVKLSYDGTVSTGAAFDHNFVHVWTQVGDDTQRLSISDGARGSLNGKSIGVAYDGLENILHIRAEGVDYTATLANGTLTLTDGDGQITQWTVLSGSFPPDAYSLMGTWTGDIQMPNTNSATLVVNNDLTATFNAVSLGKGVFDDAADALTWTKNDVEYKATYDSRNDRIALVVTFTADEIRSYSATLIRAE